MLSVTYKFNSTLIVVVKELIGALISGVLPTTKILRLAACQNDSCYNEVILLIQVSF